MNPIQSREDWKSYVAELSGESLRNKAIAANTLVFVTTLLEEGSTPEDVTYVLTAFALRLMSDGQAIPQGMPGEYCNLAELLRAVLLSEEEEDGEGGL